jgi:hypothetical protein
LHVPKIIRGALVLGSWAGLASIAAAQPAGEAASAAGQPAAEAETGPAEPAEPPEDPTVIEARERFNRGVAFYDEGSFGAALAEFQRAYELTGNWNVLYNLGQVSQALDRPADALRYFEDYLAGGGAGIAPERVAEVQQAMGGLRREVAVLRVTVDVGGADILVDDAIVGTSPLAEPLYVAPGPHTVAARHPDHATVRREVMLASDTEEAVSLVLVEPTPTRPPPPPAPAGEEEWSIAEQWWFWTIIGTVVAGGAVTAGVLLAQPETVWTTGTAGTLDLRTIEHD